MNHGLMILIMVYKKKILDVNDDYYTHCFILQ